MKIKNIIFDWDGTLGMTLHLWLAGYRLALQDQGHTTPDSIIARDFFYEHDKGQLKYPDINFVKLVDDTRAHVFSNLDDLRLYEHAKETVVALHEQGINLALVSSSNRQLVEKGLSLHGLEQYFQSIISGDDITKHKPDPEAFNQTFERIDAKPEETLIIGDAKTDIIAGKNTNTITCLFTPTDNEMFYDFDALRATEPDFEITAQKDLIDIILTTNQPPSRNSDIPFQSKRF